jgi:DNA-binding PadR family transcriptional regulator
MLEKVDFPMTTSQISEFILDQGYTSYFKLQETLAEMADSDLLHIETTHNRTLYHLTPNGKETIQFFRHKISPAIQGDIDAYLTERKYKIKEEVAVKADYYLNPNHEYEVECQITEDGVNLLELRFTIPTESEAKAIVSNWSSQCQDIYSLLLTKLL